MRAVRRGESASEPLSRQMPCWEVSTPDSREPKMSSRSIRRLPREASLSARRVAPSTGPASPTCTSVGEVVPAELEDPHPRDPVVLPQTEPGGGVVQPLARREDEEHPRRADQLVDDRPGRAVEVGRVVDHEHEVPAGPAARDRVGERVDRPFGVGGVDPELEEERGQRGEGQLGRSRRRPDRDRRHPPARPELGGGAGEPGLAHPGRPDQGEPVAPRVVERRGNRLELVVPADQRPDAQRRCRSPVRHRAIVTRRRDATATGVADGRSQSDAGLPRPADGAAPRRASLSCPRGGRAGRTGSAAGPGPLRAAGGR